MKDQAEQKSCLAVSDMNKMSRCNKVSSNTLLFVKFVSLRMCQNEQLNSKGLKKKVQYHKIFIATG